MNRVLILFAHPAIQKSRVNRRLASAVQELPNVTFHDLYEEYPDLEIDVPREQKLLREHDVLVFQHPFYWYSTPAIMKEWCDLVLEYGFAYGEGGTALEGKTWVHALTTGGMSEAYAPDGINRYTIAQFLTPLEQTANLCGIHFLPPFVVHATHRLDSDRAILRHAMDYRQFVEKLRDTPRVGTPR
jgi:glutathione-regulated potassium-efflux system ancillary protein KefG